MFSNRFSVLYTCDLVELRRFFCGLTSDSLCNLLSSSSDACISRSSARLRVSREFRGESHTYLRLDVPQSPPRYNLHSYNGHGRSLSYAHRNPQDIAGKSCPRSGGLRGEYITQISSHQFRRFVPHEMGSRATREAVNAIQIMDCDKVGYVFTDRHVAVMRSLDFILRRLALAYIGEGRQCEEHIAITVVNGRAP